MNWNRCSFNLSCLLTCEFLSSLNSYYCDCQFYSSQSCFVIIELQLPMQSVPITTKVVSSISAHDEVYSIQHLLCDKVCQWPSTGQWFSPGTLVSSTNKTDRHDTTEILLKVELNTIILTESPELYSGKCVQLYSAVDLDIYPGVVTPKTIALVFAVLRH